MRLLADVPLPSVAALRQAGHDVTWARTDAPGAGDLKDIPRDLAWRSASQAA